MTFGRRKKIGEFLIILFFSKEKCHFRSVHQLRETLNDLLFAVRPPWLCAAVNKRPVSLFERRDRTMLENDGRFCNAQALKKTRARASEHDTCTEFFMEKR